MGHDHSYNGIEDQRQRFKRLGLGLGSQFERRSVGPRSSIEDTFLVNEVSIIYTYHAALVYHNITTSEKF